MDAFYFKNRQVAERAKDNALKEDGFEGSQGLFVTDLYWFKTPSAGIPARSGDALGSADCNAYTINEDAEFEALEDSGGTQIVAEVLNPFTSAAVGVGEKYVGAMRSYGHYVAIVEDCG